MLHLKEYRKKAGLNQEDVAKVLDISRQGYSHYETGKRTPDYEVLLILAELFGTSVEALATGKEELGINFEYQGKEKSTPAIHRSALHKKIDELTDDELDELILFLDFLEYKRVHPQ